MGHEISSMLFKKSKYKNSEKAIQTFIDSHEDDRCFNLTSPSHYKSCYVDGSNEQEIVNNFEKILSQRYGGYGSYASVLLPVEKVFQSKKVLAINEKNNILYSDISKIQKEHIAKMQTQKVVKCKDCKHIQSKVRSLLICEKCDKTLLKDTTTNKIQKITDKISLNDAKREEIISKAKKEEYWIVGLEFHV